MSSTMRARGVSVTSLLAQTRYEVIPLDGALEEASCLPAGTTVTVTCSPTRGLAETITLTETLAAAGLRAVPHLAARGVHSEPELETIVRRLERAGTTDVFVVGGDQTEPAGPYANGLALLEALTRIGHRFTAIGVPAYPEGHPAIDTATLEADLHAKQEHATYCVTQLCFDADAVVGWIAQARTGGMRLPVFLGLPGVVDRKRLLRVSLRVGVGPSLRFLTRHRALLPRLLQPGGHRPEPLLRRIAERLPYGSEVHGVHLYTFNHVSPTWQWTRRIHASSAVA